VWGRTPNTAFITQNQTRK